ncbi:MAG: NADH-quinone oxidoreductase subunit C, partial [Pseudomonadota bacterium]
LQKIGQEYIQSIEIDQDHDVCLTCKRDVLVEMCRLLRDDRDCQFKMLVDLAGVDYPSHNPRFAVVYQLLSLQYNQRMKLKVFANSEDSVPTVMDLWPSANWYEREVWDMYGIFFSGHSDLRRILTDYGFSGHPQRKDFPLSGYIELRYSESKKRVVYEPVKLAQAFRTFDFASPWEAMENNSHHFLPGDEKADIDPAHAKDIDKNKDANDKQRLKIIKNK